METILVVIVAAALVLFVFWLVAKTIGKLRVVKNSPTLDDIHEVIDPNAVAARGLAGDAYHRQQAERLSGNVRALADRGDKISAVKMYMDDTGVSLSEAKKVIDTYLN